MTVERSIPFQTQLNLENPNDELANTRSIPITLQLTFNISLIHEGSASIKHHQQLYCTNDVTQATLISTVKSLPKISNVSSMCNLIGLLMCLISKHFMPNKSKRPKLEEDNENAKAKTAASDLADEGAEEGDGHCKFVVGTKPTNDARSSPSVMTFSHGDSVDNGGVVVSCSSPSSLKPHITSIWIMQPWHHFRNLCN